MIFSWTGPHLPGEQAEWKLNATLPQALLFERERVSAEVTKWEKIALQARHAVLVC